nr:zinc finger, CCHC-type, retrotransposon Gag domain protein [Tanacetum cinerariifolium]
MNFILDQEERVKQLEGYMKVIIGDFMQFSLKVTMKLKEMMREEASRMRKIEKITKYLDKETLEPLAEHKFPENPAKETFHGTLNSIYTNLLWIAHIDKLFEVLGCDDEFKAMLASYKFEGDALSWWKAFKQAKGGEACVATLSWKDFQEIFFLQYFPMFEQQKYEREYHTIRQREDELTGEFMKRFLRLTGFVGKKAGHPEEQAKHFKWALCDWILDGIVNTEFTDVAQVANAGRNIELIRKRGDSNNKRNRNGDCIQPAARNYNHKGYDQRRSDEHGYDRQNNNQRDFG